jgi:hypothetical protein
MPGLTLDVGWLSRLEREDHDFSSTKLASLCLVYKVPPSTLLQMLLTPETMTLMQRRTSLILDTSLLSTQAQVGFIPMNRQAGRQQDETGLVSSMAETWQQVFYTEPPSSFQLGLIGRADFTLWPLISPGAVVTIDRRHRIVDRRRLWVNEHERPIYFFETRQGYACGWCDLDTDSHSLSVVPHPLSPVPVTRFRFPDDIDILGRVVSVSMSLETRPPTAPTSR